MREYQHFHARYHLHYFYSIHPELEFAKFFFTLNWDLVKASFMVQPALAEIWKYDSKFEDLPVQDTKILPP